MEMPRCLYTMEHFFFFYNWEALRYNLHDNVYRISFILPGKCVSLDSELIMSIASLGELTKETINVRISFYDFRKIVINAL